MFAKAVVGVKCATPTVMSVQANATGENNGGRFCPELDDGVNVTCLIDHGVGTGQMWMEPDGTKPSCVSYAYAQSGYQTIHLYCSVDNTFFYENKTLYVGEEIDGVTVGDENGGSLIPMPMSATLYVTYVNGSDVNVEIFSNTTNTIFLSTNITNSSSTHTITAADVNNTLGVHAVRVTLSNPISSVIRWVAIAHEEEITGFNFTGFIQPIMHVADEVELNFTLSTGSSVSVATEISNSLIVQKCEGVLRTYSYVYVLNETGSYTVVMTLSNFVSTFNWTFDITVQYPVHNVTIQQVKNIMKGATDTWVVALPADSLFPMGNLFAVIEEDGVQQDNVSLTLTPGNSQNIARTYSTAGYFNITVKIQSEISEMVISWIQVVENELSLELLHLDRVPTSESQQELVLRITDPSKSPLFKLNCTLDVDGEVSTLDVPVFNYGSNETFNYRYVGIGNKTVTVNCSNTLRNWVYTKIVEVYTDCFASADFFSTAFKSLATPMKVSITQIVQITAKVEVSDLCKNSSRTYWWDFYDVPHNDLSNPELREYYNNTANQPQGVTITFAKEAIEAGLKRLVLRVNLTDQEGGVLEDFIYVNFITPPIVAQITGGSEITHGKQTNLRVDATLSRDPVQIYVDQPFDFTWNCFKIPYLNLSDLTDFMGKFQTSNEITPLWPNCTTTALPTEGIITIPSTELEDSFYYLFIVTVEKFNVTSAGLPVQRNDSVFQAVKIVPYEPPKAELKCLRNCMQKINRNSVSSFEVKCSNCDTNTLYKWDFEKYDVNTGTFSSLLNGADGPDAYIETRTLELSYLALKKDVLPEGNQLRLKCHISLDGKNATVSKIFSVNYSPRGGTCEINPVTGEASITYFEIKCKDWKDEEDRNIMDDTVDMFASLKYKIYQYSVRNGTLVTSYLGESTEPNAKVYLGIGDPSNDYNSNITIYIYDKYNGMTAYSLPIQVTNPLASSTLPSDTNVDDYYKKVMEEIQKTGSPELLMKSIESITSVLTDFTIVANDSYPNIEVSKVPTRWNEGLIDLQDVNGTQVMASYDAMLEDILQQSQNRYQIKVQETITNLTQNMLDQLQRTNSSTFSWVETASSAFGNALMKEDFISEESVVHASQALKQLTGAFSNLTISQYLGDDSIFSSSSSAIEQAASGIMQLMDSIVVNAVPNDNVNTSDALVAATDTASSRLYVNYLFAMNEDAAYEYAENGTLTPEERVGMFYMKSRISQIEFEKKRRTSEESGRALNDAVESLTKSMMSVECTGCTRTYTKPNMEIYIQKDTVGILEAPNGTSVSLNLSLSFGALPKDKFVQFSATEMKKNIYLYDHSKTAALITSPVQKLSAKSQNGGQDLSVYVVTIQQPVKSDFSEVKLTKPAFISGDASGFFYHTFLYRNLGDYACFHIVQQDPPLNEKYDVYLRAEDFPTIFQYDAKTEVSVNRDYMACIPPQKLTSVGIMHMGLKPTPIPYHTGRRKRAAAPGGYNGTDPKLNPYRLMVVSAGCNTWNENKEKWRSDSCLMDWKPTQGEVACECTGQNGMTFANSFYVAPNTIDFATVFLKFSPKDQAAVLATFALILVLYIALMIWGRHQDKKDIVRWGVTPLIDNFVDDTYYYLITVYTGMRRGAGTKSRVGFIVAGEDGDTGVRELFDGVRTEFRTASVNHFLMATSQPLGPLTYLYIFHDNSGEGEWSSWYLNRVDVEDLQDRTRFVFMCGRWLSLDNLESQVEAVLPVCGRENVTTFKNMFYINYKESLADNHLWISIYFRPTSSHFTRIQRITCLLLFIMLTMIGNAVYFRPEDEYENPETVKLGPLQFSWQTVFISIMSTLISTPAVILVVTLFKKAKPRVTDYDVKDSSLKYSLPVINSFMDKVLKESKELERTLVAKGVMSKDGTILPFWVTYIAWFLALAGSFTSAFFIMLFSMEWGKTKTEMWLAQFFLSFLESACILDPLKVVMMAAVFALIFQQTEKFRPSGLTREIVLKNYRQRYGQEQSIRIPAPPLNHSLLEKAREERMRDIKMMDSVKQVFVTLIYIWIIYSISFSNRDTGSYYVQRDISKRLLTPFGAQKFEEIKTTEQYLDWLKKVAFPTLFPEKEYNGDRLYWRHRQYAEGLTNFRVGPPRLRQVRVVEGEETIHPFGSVKIYPSYSILNEEARSFCFGWAKLPCDIKAEAYSFSFKAWKYTNPFDIWGVPVLGYYNSYSGGGYIAELDVNLDFTNRTMQELTQNLWIDRSTRAVFFEFTVYNADFNVFTYSMLATEFPEVGGVMTMSTIYPFRLYHHVGQTGYYVIFCEICFVLFLVAQIIRVIYYLYKLRLQFFKSTWLVLDFVGIFLSFVAIAMYAGRMLLANETFAKFKADPKAFVNFQHIAYWDSLFIILIGLLVFLGTTRLLGILGYDKRIGQVFRVFDNCAWDLLWFGVFFLCLFVFYAILGYLLFGRDLESYYDIFQSLGTLFISMIGKSKFNEINEADPLMAQFYFFTYVLFIVYFLLTMFLAILCESINVVHQKTKLDRSDELVMYLIDKVRDFFSRNKDGKKAHKDFTSIMAEHQKPLNLLKELRKDIDSAMSAYSEQEDKDKQDRMKKRGKEFLKKLEQAT
ncbi:uncharacterized protein LOC133184503 [Saccostrea echinata]|uniref:uncharacterized protein LOC133184503 n=1 Tax=Saccostrea echinata TaxID=191078 RepID=UPI002A82AA11|nr:uncharacterized protein LOC133184503 [Saccostrea echinata]